MKHMHSKKIILCLGLFTALSFSCTKLDQVNPSYPTVESYFKTSTQLLGGTNSIYVSFHAGFLVGREWFYLNDLRSDEFAAGGGQLEVVRSQLLNGTALPSNTQMATVWNGLYILIHRANAVISNAPKVEDNAALRDRCVAEAKCLRAWAYYNLVTLWGGVPIRLTPVGEIDDYSPRSSPEKVYAQIVTDLTDAAAVLPASYTGADLGRVTKGAAQAILGKVYIQKGDYALAKAEFEKLTASGLYALTDNYTDNFDEEHEFNKESIMEAIYFDRGDRKYDASFTGDGAATAQTTLRNQEYNPLSWRNLIPSDKYLNEFESTVTGFAKTDPRLAASVYLTGDKYDSGNTAITDADQNGSASIINGKTIKAGWRKYNLIYKQAKAVATKTYYGGINQRVIRYGDIILLLAECENELGNPTAAVKYLNQIRSRPSVSMPVYPTAQFPVNSKSDIIKALVHERMVELGGEEVRNFDLLRWRKKSYFSSDPLSYFKTNRDELLPIPQDEIANNPAIGKGDVPAQNPGY
jgi:tetratricopeptide (TPR) repeat protein